MSKFLYPIYKLNIESYKKWWLYNKKAGGSGVLSQILEGFSFNLENTLNRKFKLFEIEGNSVQNGTPSPDNEQPIKSAGDNGSINEKIKNANGTEEQDYSIPVQQPFRSNKDKTIRDKFVIKSDNKKYERHWIGEVVLNGTEYWELLNSTSDYYEFITYNSLKPVAPSSYTFPMASHFGNATNNRCVANGNQLLIRVPASMNITNATEFKTWLQENNVTINYLLAEPLDLPCTPEQIQQLENKPSTYKDFTIIQSEDETPAYLKIQYWKEVQS